MPSTNKIPQFPDRVVTTYIENLPASNTGKFLLYESPINSGGSFVQGLVIKGGGTTVADKVRIWINVGQDVNLESNNSLYQEITVSAITASATVATFENIQILDLVINSGYRIYISHSNTTNSFLVNCFALVY